MTDEIITMIKQAEAEGVALKEAAIVCASKTVSNAETQAEKTLAEAEEFCRSYRETQTKLAEMDAQKAYEATLEESLKSARLYAEKAFSKAEDEVAKIVGRVVSGSR